MSNTEPSTITATDDGVTYFARHYRSLSYPLPEEGGGGLRRGQLGALHAIAAHFGLRDDPAVVTMPTGSGKSAVLVGAAFLLRARRVLVITPSKFVRSQLTSEFRTLSQLRRAGALPSDLPTPTVHEVRHRVSDAAGWEALRAFDVVVGTPMCVSPALGQVAPPPSDFFDLVLMDEAHHSPAPTWREILAAFPDARALLVTATPFRRDRREIRGRFIFDYSVRLAMADNVFGRIEFVPVDATSTQAGNDEAIARKVEALLRADREAGFVHALMIRTDAKARAEELAALYARVTGLKLERVHSGLSTTTILRTVERLRAGELDGVIAVDMLGEGFDFPNLKIAAVHSPHKSLAATLQFIGRFARVRDPHIGQARVVAVPQEIAGAVSELFDEGSVWEELVPRLSDARVDAERHTREVLEGFHRDELIPVDDQTADLSLYGFRPLCHAKVYRVPASVDIAGAVQLPAGLALQHREVTEDGSTVLMIVAADLQPRWAPEGRFVRRDYEYIILHLERTAGLLFISTSLRKDRLYRQIVEALTEDSEILSVDVIHRVLRDIQAPKAFNVGMRNRTGGGGETYRILSGSSADTSITLQDGQRFHRGHAMIRGEEGGTPVTIGLSSASKLWGAGYQQIPDLLAWCQRIAAKLARTGAVATHTNFDLLPMSEQLSALPAARAIAVDWDVDVYDRAPMLRTPDGSECPLLDTVLTIETADPGASIQFRVATSSQSWLVEFTLSPRATFAPVGWSADDGPSIAWDEEWLPLLEFLQGSFVTFYYPDFSALTGREYLPAVTDGVFFPPERIEPVDWAAAGVDICHERIHVRPNHISIHEYLRQRLSRKSHTAVVYDDGSGEVADFVAFDDSPDSLLITLFHAKASSKATPGERVEDVYEVCGQAVKSLRWLANPVRLVQRLLARTAANEADTVVVGARASLKRIGDAAKQKQVRFRMVLVQPGIARTSLSQESIALPLGAAETYIKNANGTDALLILGSS